MHVRRALALTLAVPVLLAGCSDDDPEPTPKMPEPTSSSPTPSPTESEEPEAESPEEFIRRWVEISNAMQNSGDTSAYLAISNRCRACREVAERVQNAFRAGGFVETDGWAIKEITDRSGGASRQIMDVRVTSSPTVIKETSTAKKQEYPGGQLVYRFRLNSDAPWEVVQLTQVAS